MQVGVGQRGVIGISVELEGFEVVFVPHPPLSTGKANEPFQGGMFLSV